MTNRIQACLSPERLTQIGQNEISADELLCIEEHVSECERCREMFDDVYATTQWRDEIRPALLEPKLPDAVAFDDDAPEQWDILKLLGPTDDPQMLGRIGNYEVVGLIGQGGMGAVFKGFDRSLNRFVAIKMLLPHLATSGAARKRFAREGQAVAAVVDDHVTPIHCVDQWQGIPYLVMNYSRGVSLQKRLSDNGPLEIREILRIGMQAAKGLAAAHAQGIIHRDVKPANIFLDQNVERVQLMDFGLARAIDDASLTRSGTLAGTPQYMSPEQARAESVDHRSDLFSLGSVLYAMCVGHAPFRAESSYSVLRLIIDKEPRPIREINPDVPDWLCSIISKLMSKNADDRHKTAAQVAELLEVCLAHVQQPTTTPLPRSLTKVTKSTNRIFRSSHFRWLVGTAFVLTMFLAGLVILIETGKGTLTIESNSDSVVPIRITQGEKTVESLRIGQQGGTTRLRAGNYKIEIDGDVACEIVGDTFTLKRSGEWIARIRQKPNDHTEAVSSMGDRPLPAIIEKPQVSDHQSSAPTTNTATIDANETKIAENDQRDWQQSDRYVAPDFKRYFPDSQQGGTALDVLWKASDKDSRSDSEILKTVREGFRTTQMHRMPILRWIGNKYIWNKAPQNPEAIEIMYHAADFSGDNSNPSGARGAAVYFGLSVTHPKTPAILRTLAELGMRVDDPNDLDRIAWGSRNQNAELLEYLKPFQESNEEAIRTKAEICRKIFSGELAAFAWAAEQAKLRAEKKYAGQLPQFKEDLLSGSSEVRLKTLQIILQDRVSLIMDDSFLAGFSKCAEDENPLVRKQATIIAGGKWVWEAREQNADAIKLMLRLSKDANRDVRYNAVYYGLSTVRNKDDDVLRRLLEMAFEDREWNLFGRIEWGLRGNETRVGQLLDEYVQGENETYSKAATEVRKKLLPKESPTPETQKATDATKRP